MLKRYEISVAVILLPNLQYEVCTKFYKKLLMLYKKLILPKYMFSPYTHLFFTALYRYSALLLQLFS